MPEALKDLLLPIFPLASVVLFPAVAVPLYIFEPRYRQMTKDALAGTRRIGMVAVDPRDAASMSGNPPVFEIGCEGEIRTSDERPDGTFHILLHGLRRFRIRREVPHGGAKLYRSAEVETLDDPAPAAADPAIARARTAVLDLMVRLAPDPSESFDRERFASVDDLRFVNAFCQAASLPTVEKQKLLEANTVRDRAELLVSLLQFQLAERSGWDAGSGETVH